MNLVGIFFGSGIFPRPIHLFDRCSTRLINIFDSVGLPYLVENKKNPQKMLDINELVMYAFLGHPVSIKN